MIEPGKYSFVIVSKNNELTIRRTLSSIQSQNYENFEAIVVDDNSSDYTTNIVYNEFCKRDSRFKLIAGGIYKNQYIDAANEGLEQTTGEFIQFIDPGVYFHNNTYLNGVIKTFKECKSDYTYKNKYNAISFQTENKELSKLDTLIRIKNIDITTSDAIKFNSDNSMIVDGYYMWNSNGAICEKKFLDEHNIKFTSVDYPDFVFWTDVWSYGAKMNLFIEAWSYFIETSNNIKNNFITNEVQYLIARARERYARDFAHNSDQAALFNRTAAYFLKEIKHGRK